jgi:hypothetical protein
MQILSVNGVDMGSGTLMQCIDALNTSHTAVLKLTYDPRAFAFYDNGVCVYGCMV